MKSYDGKEIRVGCVLKSEISLFCRVDYVGKERIITADSKCTLKEARNTEHEGTSWSQEEINEAKLTLVEYAPLGVYDEDGREYHEYDEVEFQSEICKVFGAIKSKNGDGRDSILFEKNDAVGGGGWLYHYSKGFSILPIKPSFIGKEVEVKLDGKSYVAKIVKEGV